MFKRPNKYYREKRKKKSLKLYCRDMGLVDFGEKPGNHTAKKKRSSRNNDIINETNSDRKRQIRVLSSFEKASCHLKITHRSSQNKTGNNPENNN